MTIDEAIEINQALLNGDYDHRDNVLEDAIKLGIDALKQRLKDLEGNPLLDGELLPGETK